MQMQLVRLLPTSKPFLMRSQKVAAELCFEENTASKQNGQFQLFSKQNKQEYWLCICGGNLLINGMQPSALLQVFCTVQS